MIESILTNIGLKLVEWLWAKIEVKLEAYFEMKSQIKAISNEAASLKEELKNASNDEERFQILRKIGNFQDRIGN